MKGKRYALGHKREYSIEEREGRRQRMLGKRYSLGKKHSEETKRKISNAQKGSLSRLWRGGITPLNKVLRNTVEMKIWREAVFKRDNYTCQECGARNGNGYTVTLNADHIKPFMLFPELRFSIDNGRTLCVKCHKKTLTYGGKTRVLTREDVIHILSKKD